MECAAIRFRKLKFFLRTAWEMNAAVSVCFAMHEMHLSNNLLLIGLLAVIVKCNYLKQDHCRRLGAIMFGVIETKFRLTEVWARSALCLDTDVLA